MRIRIRIEDETKLLDLSTLFSTHCSPFIYYRSPPAANPCSAFNQILPFSLILNFSIFPLSLSLCPLMASESSESRNPNSILDQLLPEGSVVSSSTIVVGLMGPSPDGAPDRVVFLNPVTQGMVVLRGDAGEISEILGGGGGEGGGGEAPASKASIEAMRSVGLEELEGSTTSEECPVCLDGLKEAAAAAEKGIVKEMPCRHRFHGGCIEKWLKMHGSCPLCRFKMPIEEEEDKGVKDDGGGEEERRARGRFLLGLVLSVRDAMRARQQDAAGGDEEEEEE